MDVEEIAKLVKIPSFSDVVKGHVGIEGTGTFFRVLYTRKVSLLIPETLTQIVTHTHTDQMPAIVRTVITPAPAAYKTRVIYRQYGLKPKVVPWAKFRKTFHYNKEVPVFSSVMEFSDFAVIGESAEQISLYEQYSKSYPHGVLVRTPRRDTKEKPFFAPPEGWLFADNTARTKTASVLLKICPTLRDMDMDEHIREAVLEYVRTSPDTGA